MNMPSASRVSTSAVTPVVQGHGAFMRRVLQAAAVSLLLVIALPARADAPVWQASKGDNTVFLGGTIHLLRAQDYPLPEAFETAYQASDRLFFEIDQNQMTDMSVQARMMQQLTYQDDRTLQSVLDDETYAALTAYAENAGLPMAMMQKFKPGMLLTTLSLLEFQSRGFTPQGVDAYYNSRAMGDGKDRGELETIDQQIAMLASMGEGYESEFVTYSLRDLETVGDAIEDMLAAWRAGDQASLEAQFIAPMLAEAPELYDSMLVERNNNWMSQIEAMFDEPGTEFVLVGAAHLVGEHGVLAMLSERGYEIDRVSAD
ncbi:TraB/GumN family protein [Pseudohongiella sp.]|uniref:TraB/GumN family protein n=1 Tax=marine sediment metagenome TaxID=412755 RepID=A0A0F9Y3F6_9ZZZZ|nr:TraB/GumN family protein [Pseudohongiella sp.]HDZ08801.1 TraB/GumN family protein [Pseudohongiella sp.]HEA62417.1 TraB/GumN family protein [Pseudohongiella sp.]